MCYPKSTNQKSQLTFNVHYKSKRYSYNVYMNLITYIMYRIIKDQ